MRNLDAQRKEFCEKIRAEVNEDAKETAYTIGACALEYIMRDPIRMVQFMASMGYARTHTLQQARDQIMASTLVLCALAKVDEDEDDDGK